jgi:hypothetical protein
VIPPQFIPLKGGVGIYDQFKTHIGFRASDLNAAGIASLAKEFASGWAYFFLDKKVGKKSRLHKNLVEPF